MGSMSPGVGTSTHPRLRPRLARFHWWARRSTPKAVPMRVWRWLGCCTA